MTPEQLEAIEALASGILTRAEELGAALPDAFDDSNFESCLIPLPEILRPIIGTTLDSMQRKVGLICRVAFYTQEYLIIYAKGDDNLDIGHHTSTLNPVLFMARNICLRLSTKLLSQGKVDWLVQQNTPLSWGTREEVVKAVKYQIQTSKYFAPLKDRITIHFTSGNLCDVMRIEASRMFEKPHHQHTRGMRISLDFDGTYTNDPEGFLNIAKYMRRRGHEVYLVTMRYPSECKDLPPELISTVNAVHATSRQPKRTYMNNIGIKIDVWIDDEPRVMDEDPVAIWGNCTPEGTVFTPILD